MWIRRGLFTAMCVRWLTHSSASINKPIKAAQTLQRALRPVVLGATASFQVFCGTSWLPGSWAPAPAAAKDIRSVGEIAGSGFVIKDSLKVEALDDPKIEGVSIYISDFTRPITDRLTKDFFSDPSSASLGCAASANPKVLKKLSTSPNGEELFSEARSLFFKTIRVRRLYDEEAGNVVYVAYNTRVGGNDSNKSRYKSSICAVHIGKQTAASESED